MTDSTTLVDSENLRCLAAALEEAGWPDIYDAVNAAVQPFYEAADEIDRLRALAQNKETH